MKAAALECFREHGFEAASIDAIARRANVAVGAVYLHFKSKRQLLLVLMDELLESLASVHVTLTAPDPQIAIRSLLRHAFNRDVRFLGAYRAWQEAVLTDHAPADRDEAIHAWTQRRVVQLIAALRRMPGARRDLDVARLSALLDRVLWSLMAQALCERPAELLRLVDVAADMTYHTVFEGRTRR